MTIEDFILVCDIQRILDSMETKDVHLSIQPISDDGSVRRFYVSCQNRGSTYTCGRIFHIEDLLCEDDHEEYFSNKIAYLVEKCEKHMEA